VGTFLGLKRIVESENMFGHGRTGRIGCAGLDLERLHTKHFSREVGLLCLRKIIPFVLHRRTFLVGFDLYSVA